MVVYKHKLIRYKKKYITKYELDDGTIRHDLFSRRNIFTGD